MEALLQADSAFAESCRQVMEAAEPADDELLQRARAGEFGDRIFRVRYEGGTE